MNAKEYIAAVCCGVLEDKEVTPDELYVILQELATIVNTSDNPEEALDKIGYG